MYAIYGGGLTLLSLSFFLDGNWREDVVTPASSRSFESHISVEDSPIVLLSFISVFCLFLRD